MADSQTVQFRPVAPEQVAELRRRNPKPSKYLEAVKAILGKGDQALEVPAEQRRNEVTALYTAAKQAGLKIRVSAPKDKPSLILVTVTQKPAAK